MNFSKLMTGPEHKDIITMALKARFALLAFIVCTSYTSLRLSWSSVHTSQRSMRASQIPLSVRTSQRSVCTSHLSLSSSKIKHLCAFPKHWCAVLKASTAQYFGIALLTSEISFLHIWSTTLRISEVPHWVYLKYHCGILKFLPHFSGYANYLKTLGKNIQRRQELAMKHCRMILNGDKR